MNDEDGMEEYRSVVKTAQAFMIGLATGMVVAVIIVIIVIG